MSGQREGVKRREDVVVLGMDEATSQSASQSVSLGMTLVI